MCSGTMMILARFKKRETNSSLSMQKTFTRWVIFLRRSSHNNLTISRWVIKSNSKERSSRWKQFGLLWKAYQRCQMWNMPTMYFRATRSTQFFSSRRKNTTLLTKRRDTSRLTIKLKMTSTLISNNWAILMSKMYWKNKLSSVTSVRMLMAINYVLQKKNCFWMLWRTRIRLRLSSTLKNYTILSPNSKKRLSASSSAK